MTALDLAHRAGGDPGLADAAVAYFERWLPLVFGMAALFVYGLWYWNPLYRYDEYLVAVARTGLPWDELLRVIATSDPAAGPLYLLMKPWTAISSDPWWTRIPSVVAMAVAVGALVAFVRRAVDTPTAVFAGFLMIVLPATSRWAQDNRMYAPATACIVVAVLCCWRSVTGGSLRWSVLYGAAVVGAGLFHLYALAVIPALLVAALWVPGSRRSNVIRTIVPLAVAVVVLSPHVILNLWHPTGSPTNPPATLRNIAAMLAGNEGRVLALLTTLLAMGGTIWSWRFRDRWAVVALGAGWVLIPLAGFVLARALIGMPTLAPRYFVFLIPGGCILAALAIAALYDRWRPAAIVVVLIFAAVALPSQIEVRSVASHSSVVYHLGRLLDLPELAGLPVLGLTPSATVTVGAATYPDRRLAAQDALPQPTALIVGGLHTWPRAQSSPYLRTGGPWRLVVLCRPGPYSIAVVATPDATLPHGDARTLAQELNTRAPGSRCAATSSLP